MLNKTLFSIVFLTFFNLALASDFEVRIVSHPEIVIQGTPGYVTAEMRNISGHAITVPTYLFGFVGEFIVKRQDGKPRTQSGSVKIGVFKSHPYAEILPADWTRTKIVDIFEAYRDEPGTFLVQFVLSSSIPEAMESASKDAKKLKTWTGELRTPEIQIQLEEPAALDAEAYKTFNGFPLAKPDDLLMKYPTSTYAAWAIINIDCGARLPGADGKKLVDDMFRPWKEKDIYRGTSGVKGKDKNTWVTPEEFAENFIPKAEKVLQVHSNHPNAGIIYARLSLAYMVLHRWQDAFLAAKKSLELPWAEWVYASYFPRLEMEKQVLREAKDELLKRGLAKDRDK